VAGSSIGSEWTVRAVHCQNAHLSVGGIGMVAWLAAYDLTESYGEVPSAYMQTAIDPVTMGTIGRLSVYIAIV
jgi:hypothetical protein